MAANGLAYAHPWIYSGVMRVLHWGAFSERYAVIARRVPSDAAIVDLCCGDAALAKHLPAGARYLGLDANERFVRHARGRGLDVRRWDAMKDAVPAADVVVIQASLYQFHPEDKQLLERSFAAARTRLIIAEPVVNWSTHGKAWQKALARRMTRVGGQKFEFRHDETTLDALVSAFPSQRIIRERSGRDLVIAIDK
jgi:hypothetical protein